MRLTAVLRSIVPVDHLQVVGNGMVVADLPLAGDRTSASVTRTIAISHSGWYVLRAYADGPAHPVMDIYPYATTSPIYVSVDGAPVRSPEDARFFLAWIDRLEKAARGHRGWNSAAEKEAVLDDLARARAVYQEQATP